LKTWQYLLAMTKRSPKSSSVYDADAPQPHQAIDLQASLRFLETPGAIDLIRAWSWIKGSELRRAFISIAEAAVARDRLP
jgi:hypothetical protein